MTLDEAREIVSKADKRGEYFDLAGDPNEWGDERYVIDGRFSIQELEAMLVILRSTPDTGSAKPSP